MALNLFKYASMLTVYLIVSSSLTACDSSSATNRDTSKSIEKETIDAYLEAIVYRDLQAAKELFCVPSKHSAYLKRKKNEIKDFEILDISSKKLKDSNFEYNEAYVEEITEKKGEQQNIKRSYPVWDTEDHYQYMTRKYREYSKNPDVKMDRTKWSSRAKCIAKDSNMSTNYELLPLKNPFQFFGDPVDNLVNNSAVVSPSNKSDMYAEYKQVEIGMDIDEVKEILKDYSVEDRLRGDRQTSYKWTIPKGKYIIIVRTVDNKVKSKSIRYY